MPKKRQSGSSGLNSGSSSFLVFRIQPYLQTGTESVPMKTTRRLGLNPLCLAPFSLFFLRWWELNPGCGTLGKRSLWPHPQTDCGVLVRRDPEAGVQVIG